MGVVFIPLGVVCHAASASVMEVSRRYDHLPECATGFFATPDEVRTQTQTNGEGTTCAVTLTVPERMRAPVYVYYELTNFYQNHRRFVRSRNDEQLLTGRDDGYGMDQCAPQLRRTDPVTGAVVGTIDPCGLAAWSFFNDTYAFALNGAALGVDERGISWRSDREFKFGAHATAHFNDENATRGGGAIDGSPREDEHFVVWMRTAAMNDFRKLWGKIDVDLPKGAEVRVAVRNRYNSYKYGGSKSVALSTTSWLGGKNDFLGAAYLSVGSMCVAASAVFAYFAVYPPRKLGDPDELSWNK